VSPLKSILPSQTDHSCIFSTVYFDEKYETATMASDYPAFDKNGGALWQS
jgi:hypothetical protein